MYSATGTPLSQPVTPNALWCADYKVEFMLAARRYCYPLTLTDFASRYRLRCEALSTTAEAFAFTVLERAFRDYGLPAAMRTDHGVPFASPNALYGLSRLSVWWLRLGIRLERIRPGHPEQNGRHERMHLTLKRGHETPRPEPPPAAGAVRRLRPALQRRAAPSSARDGDAGRAVCPVGAAVSRPGAAGLPVARLDRHGHQLRPDRLPTPQGQLEHRVRRPESGRAPNRYSAHGLPTRVSDGVPARPADRCGPWTGTSRSVYPGLKSDQKAPRVNHSVRIPTSQPISLTTARPFHCSE